MSIHQTPYQRLQKLVNLEREDIGTLITYGVGIGILSLATPVAVQALVNTIAFGALFQPLVVLTLVLLILLGFSNTLVALQFYVVEMLQRRLFVRMFGEFASRLQHAQYASYQKHYVPELANRFFDVVTLQKTASVLLLETLGYVLQTLIGMVLLAFYHPLLLAFDLFLIAALAFILFVMSKNGLATAIEQSKTKYLAAAWLENIAVNPLIGKSASNSAYLTEQTERIANSYLAACTKHFQVLARQNIGALLLHTLANTLLLGMGGWMVISNQLSLGQLIAAELVVGAMIFGLTRLGKTMDNFYELLTSVDKLGYLMDLPQESYEGGAPESGERPYQVDINKLSLPEGLHQDVLRNVDLHLAPGESLVISGSANHSNLLDSVFGLKQPSAGYICLDNQDLRELNLGLLRDTVNLVRNAEILEGTILENLRFGRELDLSKARETLSHVGLLDAIAAMPESLDTCLFPDGSPLTNEQCLRLTLARAIATQPKLLLIDGALDYIDDHFLPALMDHLLASDAPWTLIVTSNNPSVIVRFRRHAKVDSGIFEEFTQKNQDES